MGYYCKAYSSKESFDGLKICNSESCEEHLNQYNVINLCLNDMPDDGSTYEDYINLIKESIADDIKEAYPERKDKKFRKISELLTAT
ncbi:MAG: hypothetical protein K2G55_10035 [Lachnospiraceae bacterium]|nr:hypothetical protein [Lachnospiraceae bacterium]MDE7203595.1 hypothetical protein [Lachnospiraceae bacterium]